MIEWSILLRKPTVLLGLLGFVKQCLSPSHYMNKAATSSYRFLTYEFRKRGVIARLYNFGRCQSYWDYTSAYRKSFKPLTNAYSNSSVTVFALKLVLMRLKKLLIIPSNALFFSQNFLKIGTTWQAKFIDDFSDVSLKTDDIVLHE